MFWQPPLKEGEDVDPEKVKFLPLGFDEFYGREVTDKKEMVGMIIRRRFPKFPVCLCLYDIY